MKFYCLLLIFRHYFLLIKYIIVNKQDKKEKNKINNKKIID